MKNKRTYKNAIALKRPDIFEAVKGFIFSYARPELDDEAIFASLQNRSSLPSKHNEYASISILGSRRRGTNEEFIIEENGQSFFISRTLNFVDVQIDFLSDDDKARHRAESIDTVALSDIGVSFFFTL